MKLFEHTLKTNNHETEIVVIADAHIGSANFNETKLRETIDYIMDHDNCYCIFNGDILDDTLKNTRAGSVYENAMMPDVALSYAVQLLKPLCDAGKALNFNEGNHEQRSAKDSCISHGQILATMLGIPELYSKDSCVLLLTCENGLRGNSSKNCGYRVFVSHGNNSNGATIGSKANAVLNMASNTICNADVYVHSHSHFPLVFKDSILEISDVGKSIILRDRLFVNTNAFLNYKDSYAEQKLLKIGSMSVPKIKLRAYRKKTNGRERIIKDCTCEL